MCITFTVSITFTLIYGRIALMPPFNAGIQKLVSAFHFPLIRALFMLIV